MSSVRPRGPGGRVWGWADQRLGSLPRRSRSTPIRRRRPAPVYDRRPVSDRMRRAFFGAEAGQARGHRLMWSRRSYTASLRPHGGTECQSTRSPACRRTRPPSPPSSEDSSCAPTCHAAATLAGRRRTTGIPWQPSWRRMKVDSRTWCRSAWVAWSPRPSRSSVGRRR